MAEDKQSAVPAATPKPALKAALPAAKPAPEPVDATPSAESLLSSTFQMVMPGQKSALASRPKPIAEMASVSSNDAVPDMVVPMRQAAPAQAAETALPQGMAPTKRVVKTTIIRASAAPEPQATDPIETAALGYADAPPAPAFPAVPEEAAQQVAALPPEVEADAETTADPVASNAVKVGDSRVNVRSGPSKSKKRVFVLAPGAEVEVTETQEDWVRIVDGRGRSGWVSASFLVGDLPEREAVPKPKDRSRVASTNSEVSAKASGETWIVGGAGVNVRSGPSSSRGKVFALTAGQKVTVTETEKGWLHIVDSKGRRGWVYSKLMRQ